MNWGEVWEAIKDCQYDTACALLNPILRPLGCQVIDRSYLQRLEKFYTEYRSQCPSWGDTANWPKREGARQ